MRALTRMSRALARIRSLVGRDRKAHSELLSVEWDEEQVFVIPHPPMPSDWSQRFVWRDVTCVCFKDGGMWSSDTL